MNHDEEVAVEGVRVRYFPRHFVRGPVLSLPLMRWIHANHRGFDLIHISGVFTAHATATAWWARRSGVPYIFRP